MADLGKIWQPKNRPKTDTVSNNPLVCNTGSPLRSDIHRGKLELLPLVNFLSITIAGTIRSRSGACFDLEHANVWNGIPNLNWSETSNLESSIGAGPAR